MMLGTGAPNTSFTPIGDTLYLGQSRKFLSTTLGTAFNGSTNWLNLMCHSGSAGMLFGGSTSDATPHVNPSIYMAITNGGNVGIGIAPAHKLNLHGIGGVTAGFEITLTEAEAVEIHRYFTCSPTIPPTRTLEFPASTSAAASPSFSATHPMALV